MSGYQWKYGTNFSSYGAFELKASVTQRWVNAHLDNPTWTCVQPDMLSYTRGGNCCNVKIILLFTVVLNNKSDIFMLHKVSYWGVSYPIGVETVTTEIGTCILWLSYYLYGVNIRIVKIQFSIMLEAGCSTASNCLLIKDIVQHGHIGVTSRIYY